MKRIFAVISEGDPKSSQDFSEVFEIDPALLNSPKKVFYLEVEGEDAISLENKNDVRPLSQSGGRWIDKAGRPWRDRLIAEKKPPTGDA